MKSIKVDYKKIGLMIIALPLLYINIAMASVVSDSEITVQVKSKITTEQLIGVDFCDIKTKKGVVYIDGRIETDSQAAKIIEIAQSIKGVKDVDVSRLKVVSSKDPLEDTFITAKIKGLYLREKMFTSKKVSAFTVKVETKNGIVYLTGAANSRQEINNAIRIAKMVKGVKQVQSSIKLEV